MSKLKVQWEPSASKGTEYFEWEDLGCEDEDDWEDLEDQVQEQRIAEALDGIMGLVHAQSVAVSIIGR